jgi:hypothetical protein
MEGEPSGRCLEPTGPPSSISGDAPPIRSVLNLSLILVTPGTWYREGFRNLACTMVQRAYSWPDVSEGSSGGRRRGQIVIRDEETRGCAAADSAVCLREKLQKYPARLLANGRAG